MLRTNLHCSLSNQHLWGVKLVLEPASEEWENLLQENVNNTAQQIKKYLFCELVNSFLFWVSQSEFVVEIQRLAHNIFLISKDLHFWYI